MAIDNCGVSFHWGVNLHKLIDGIPINTVHIYELNDMNDNSNGFINWQETIN